MALPRTDYAFVLPKGVVAPDGAVHRGGTMRLATARDELAALADPRVTDADDPQLGLVVLSRVITSLGGRAAVTPEELADLYAADLAHLQDVYHAVNYGTADEMDRVLGTAATTAPLSHQPPEPPKIPDTAPPAPQRRAPAAVAAAPGPPTPVDASPPLDEAPGPPAHTDDVPDHLADAPEQVDEPAPTPTPRGRRARIEEVGTRSGRAAG